MSKVIEFAVAILTMIAAAAGLYMLADIDSIGKITNIVQVFEDAGFFLIAFVIATLLTAYLVVVADIKFIYRFMAIPAWLLFMFSLLASVDQFLGYAYPGFPEKPGELLNYKVVHDPKVNEKRIEVWLYFRDESRTRSYRFDYNPDRDEQLNEGMKSKGDGVRLTLHKGDKNDGDFELHPIPHARPGVKD